jgi:hypothetical protein
VIEIGNGRDRHRHDNRELRWDIHEPSGPPLHNGSTCHLCQVRRHLGDRLGPIQRLSDGRKSLLRRDRVVRLQHLVCHQIQRKHIQL